MPDEKRGGWLRRRMPTPETFENNRWLRPVAHRVLAPSLWRFTRRSVPRGVALGMIAGILTPVAQIPLAAIFALPARANVPVAVVSTFITNPLTIPPMWVAAYWVGSRILRLDAAVPGAPIASQVAQNSGMLHWLLAEAGPATAVGLVTMAITAAVVGYAVTAVGWRWWIARKWRRRALRRID